MPTERPPSAVIDSSIVVSGIIGRRDRAPYQLLSALYAGKFHLVVSPVILDEYHDVLQRPYIASRLPPNDDSIAQLLGFITLAAVVVEPGAFPTVRIRDPKDVPFIEAALSGSADYLISGDSDLLEVAAHPALRTTRVVTAREFLDTFGGTERSE